MSFDAKTWLGWLLPACDNGQCPCFGDATVEASMAISISSFMRSFSNMSAMLLTIPVSGWPTRRGGHRRKVHFMGHLIGSCVDVITS